MTINNYASATYKNANQSSNQYKCTNNSRCVNVQFPIIDFKLIYTNYNQHSFNSGNENDSCFSLAAATTTGHLTLKLLCVLVEIEPELEKYVFPSLAPLACMRV